MINEIIFITHTLIVAAATLCSLALGKEALVAIVCIQCILANLMVLKQTTLLGLSATCADPFTVGATLGLNLLQEYYGKEITKKTIGINFFMLIFYALMTQIQLWYSADCNDTTAGHFSALFTLAPRIIVASFTVYLFVQLLDFKLYGLLKQYFNNNFLVARNYFSIALCQGIDTVLFSFLGLYGIVNNIGHIILVSYTVKIISIAIATPLVSFANTIHARAK